MPSLQIKALFAACAIAFATTSIAAETGKGDTGPNNKAGASSMGSGSMGTSGGGTGMGKSSASAETRAMAKKDYDAAMMKCKDMKGAERSACRKDAKAARDTTMGKSASAPMAAGSMNGMKDGGKTGSAAPSAQGSASGSMSSTTAPTKGDSMPSGAKPDPKASSNKP